MNFANLGVDHWRPVEILADMVGILSGDFTDGSVLDTFILASDNANNDGGQGESSYQNQNRPYFEVGDILDYGHGQWITQDRTVATPVWIDRNGVYRLVNNAGTPISSVDPRGWNMEKIIAFANERARKHNQQTASETTVNATFVSGIIPSRPNQSNGGFHNFPSLNEWWKTGPRSNDDAIPLRISGAFLQLKFTTAATGPYDQDAWEPDLTPDGGVYFFNYDPPQRAWGYDVGILYVPAAPVARRFISYGAPRSEYYRELPVDDEYINLLRCAPFPGGPPGERIDPKVDEASCPA